MKKWIAVYTRPRHEKTVARELKKKSFEVYLPLYRDRRKWSDRKKWVEFPLFRSYVFSKIELKNSLYVLQTPGVLRIIRLGKDIAIVRDEEIKALKIIFENGYDSQSEDFFDEGDRVEIKNGPLKGIVGDVIRLNNENRLLIKVNAIQHAISIQIDKDWLNLIN